MKLPLIFHSFSVSVDEQGMPLKRDTHDDIVYKKKRKNNEFTCRKKNLTGGKHT